MSDARQLLLQMEHAEQRGDRRTARAVARAILALGNTEGRSLDGGSGKGAEADGPARATASELLQRTEPDPFLLLVGVLGLGLMVWLVYNYVL